MLLAQRPQANAALLRELVARHEDIEVATAATNLLLGFDAAGAAAPLMQDAVPVLVKLTDVERSGFSHETLVGTLEWTEVPVDFPVVNVREFSYEGDEEATLLVAGPTPVFFSVKSVEPGSGFGLRELGGGTWDDRRMLCLESLADVDGLYQLMSSWGVNVVWRDAERFLVAIERLRKQAESKWRELGDALVAKELLDRATAAKLRPRVAFRIEDHRQKKTPVPPLPREEAAGTGK